MKVSVPRDNSWMTRRDRSTVRKTWAETFSPFGACEPYILSSPTRTANIGCCGLQEGL
jgi:hypothetical protein